MSDANDLNDLVEEATFDFSMGETEAAIGKLERALKADPDSFEAWHAMAEISYSSRDFDRALEAAEKAHALRPDDVFVNTTLSRVWLEKGDKERAEHFGAQARVLGWKEQLKGQGEPDDGRGPDLA